MKTQPDKSKMNERAEMLITSAAMLWSPITRGELFELLVYMVENFNEVNDLVATDLESDSE